MSKIRKNFLKLIIGNIGVQVISMAFYPLLTRRYDPIEFGKFGVMNSVVQLISIFSWGQFHMAIPSITDKNEQNKLYSISLLMNLSFSLLCILLFGIYDYIQGMDDLYYLIPISVIFFGTIEINKLWSVANDKLGSQTLLLNINRLSSNFFKLLGNTASILMISEIAANFLASIGFMSFARKSFTFKVSKKDFIEIWNKHKDYPLFFSLYVLAQILGTEALTLYLKNYLKTEELGYFFLGNKLFVQTALILSSTLSLAYTEALTRSHEDRLKIFKKFFLVYILGLFFAGLFSIPNYTYWVQILFGDKWTNFSGFINFFIFLSPVKILVGFFAYVLLRAKMIKFISIFKITQFILLILIFQVGFSNLNEFLWLFIPLEVLGDTIFIFSGYALLKRNGHAEV